MKLGLGTLAVVLGLTLFVGATPAGRYLWSLGEVFFGKAGQFASEQVSPEVEVERLAKEIGKLDGDIRANNNLLAREAVALDTLNEEIDARRKKVEEDQADLERLTKLVDSTSGKTISLGGKNLTRDQVKARAAQAEELLEAEEAALKAKEELRDKKKATVDAARGKIEAMKEQQAKLTAELETMKTELQKVREAQAQSSSVPVDDSRLSEIKDSFKSLHARINVMKKEAELQGDVANASQAEVDQALKAEKALEKARERFTKKTAETDK